MATHANGPHLVDAGTRRSRSMVRPAVLANRGPQATLSDSAATTAGAAARISQRARRLCTVAVHRGLYVRCSVCGDVFGSAGNARSASRWDASSAASPTISRALPAHPTAAQVREQIRLGLSRPAGTPEVVQVTYELVDEVRADLHLPDARLALGVHRVGAVEKPAGQDRLRERVERVDGDERAKHPAKALRDKRQLAAGRGPV
jgi:hypothetical protein